MNFKQVKDDVMLNRICYSRSRSIILTVILMCKKYKKDGPTYVAYQTYLRSVKNEHKEKLNQTREKTQLQWNARKESRKLKLLYKGMKEDFENNKRRRI